jgi:predicted amidohydrolase YtcJ
MKAEIVLKSNAIFDSINMIPYKGFIAIKGNRILDVGDVENAEQYVGNKTKIYEYKDKLIMPGFHDSHTHLMLAGMESGCINLGDAKSEIEAVEKLVEFYRDHNPEYWVYGFNWYHAFWDNKKLPTKESLDKYFLDTPVFLLNAEAHGAWVNSKALEIAGITKDTPDPFGGEIKRYENGEPTGYLYEGAINLLSKHVFNFTKDQQLKYLNSFMRKAATLGITSVVDVRPFFGTDIGNLNVYKELEDIGKLTIRIHTAGDLLGDLDDAVNNSVKYRSNKLRANLLKQFVDGVIIAHTALLLEDYADAPGNRGYRLNNLEEIKAAVLEGHKRELSIKLHAIGDWGIRFCLDAYEDALQRYGHNRARHAIEHLELVSEEDYPRFKELRIIPSMQPEHLGLLPTWEEDEYRIVLGEKRASTTWPTKSLLNMAGVLAIGSDCPVVDCNPFLGIHRAITRIHDDGLPKGGWNPSEKLTLAEVLRGYTYCSAYGVGREDELGTIEPGKFADIIVIDRNLFNVSPDEIRSARVDLTIMDGKVIFERNY